MAHMLDLVNSLVDSDVGIIRHVQEERKEAGAPDFVCFSAQTCRIPGLNRSGYDKPLFGSGFSTDRARAFTKAIGEAIERYCAGNYSLEDFPLTAYESASFPCVKPEEFAPYTPSQYSQPRFPFAPLDRKTAVRWVPALDLLSGDTRHVPAAMVFLPYLGDKEAGERPLTPQISTGLACHTNPTLAAISAICEVIERDAVAITWQARLSWPQVRLNTLSPHNFDLIARLHRPGASIVLLNMTMDHSIPVIFAVMTSTVPAAPALVVAAAAHLDPEEAVRKSLEELAQIWSFAQREKSSHPKFSPGIGWEHVVDPKSHAAVYYDHANVAPAKFLIESTKQVSFDEVTNCCTRIPVHDLRLLADKIRAVNRRVLLADVTSEDVRDLGLFVLRAVIPGFHPLFMGHRFRALGGTRLWDVPQRLGFPGITREKGDNPFPHPFA